MLDLYHKVKNLSILYEGEEKRLVELKGQTDVLVKERSEIERIEAEEAARKKAEDDEIIHAATMIQCSFRGWRVRNPKQKKKKKGKGKKKKYRLAWPLV
eukprot:TRINITY_DN895_c0_g1_i1.p1 TRINITY_DN895_c0_g1~~TRINITY_DN895_c0_g1_i1.p1  ORF type:complete len:113 (-),score=43.37 TRINITY_DN895_c0_g1_i1:27-323(-)